MSVFERLVDNRLCDRLSPEGGEGSGANRLTEETAVEVNTSPVNDNDKVETHKPDDIKQPNTLEKPANAPDKYDFKVTEGQPLDVTAVKHLNRLLVN